MFNKRIVSGISLIVLVSLLLVVTPQPAKSAKFVLASWTDYPDEYGQGIFQFSIYENSTGAWVFFAHVYPHEGGSYKWNVTTGIKLRCFAYINSTLTNASSSEEGRNYVRHNVTVTNSTGGVVFSQANFTYVSDYLEYDPMWFYVYEVILNFLPDYNNIYTVIITYEVYYEVVE